METSYICICPKCQKRIAEAENFCPSCGEDLRGLSSVSDTLSGPWSGRVIDGRYRLLEKLGEGGMGAVFKVEHVRMGKLCALKLLRPDIALDRRLKARFLQEARVVSRLSHPNTIQVFDCGELEDGALYLAMEYLQGRDLAWVLRNKGPLREEQAISVGIQILSSLAEAHEKGIIHRDIKPANVILVKSKDRDDLVKLLDFGIAKFNEAEGRKQITGVADLIGTPAYMSPEQAQGETLDARSDLYSVGAMLFELVSGRGVFTGPTPMSVVSKHLTEPPPRLAEVAPGRPVSPLFEQLLRQALSKKREERFGSALEMRAALERVRKELGGLAQDLTPLPEDSSLLMARREDFDGFERRLRLRRVMAPLVALSLLLAAGVGLLLYFRQQPGAALTAEREPNDTPRQLNRLTLGQPVSGTIGPGAKAERSDVDLFLAEAPPGPLTVGISGVEELNLSLWLKWNEAGRERTHLVDDLGPGSPERLDALAFPGGELLVQLEERAHFTEKRRSPRERSRLEYRLWVASTEAGGELEREPNDSAGEAPLLSLEHPLTAFTGAGSRYPPPRLEGAKNEELSTVDYLLTQPAGGAQVYALVVPPAGGKLLVVDASRFEHWARSASGKPPEPAVVEEPRLFKVLLPTERGALGVRVQPDERTPAGSRYQVAFLTGPTGLSGAIELAQRLLEEGRKKERQLALQAVAETFRDQDSPQLEQIRLALKAP